MPAISLLRTEIITWWWITYHNFQLKGSLRLAEHPIAEYKEARELEVIHEQQIVGNQPGDPENDERPLHLFLGTDTFNMANSKIDMVREQLNTYESLSKSTEFRD
ncbi:hypothetical protein GXP67_11890 [Rhodocytophaga rosea]|uniref:Uncharacterized protein n=1 Tax=Rhodocytophaga rosea TaxID=2704465 RepID=A0A6C0GGZ2_9BACT|nr:hypothetical protein [Rhodocytophaga rosea]QHT67286.1 hypothetical protein GXP67_11890 [Rhodocytophaga rosea]